jgi:hypothetical protein
VGGREEGGMGKVSKFDCPPVKIIRGFSDILVNNESRQSHNTQTTQRQSALPLKIFNLFCNNMNYIL